MCVCVTYTQKKHTENTYICDFCVCVYTCKDAYIYMSIYVCKVGCDRKICSVCMHACISYTYTLRTHIVSSGQRWAKYSKNHGRTPGGSSPISFMRTWWSKNHCSAVSAPSKHMEWQLKTLNPHLGQHGQIQNQKVRWYIWATGFAEGKIQRFGINWGTCERCDRLHGSLPPSK